MIVESFVCGVLFLVEGEITVVELHALRPSSGAAILVAVGG